MTNKALAIFGIVAYILSGFTSAEDLQGNLFTPPWLILLSRIIFISFLVLAIKRIWKFKFESRLLLFSSITLFIFQLIQEITSPPYGSLIIILTNITKIVNFLAYFWAIFLLWKIDSL